MEKLIIKLESDIQDIEKETSLAEQKLTALDSAISLVRKDPTKKLPPSPQQVQSSSEKLEDAEFEKKITLMVRKQKELEEEEARYWEDLNEFEKKALTMAENDRVMELVKENREQEIKKVSEMNVFADFFNISTKINEGTINDLRIGHIPPNEQNIDWDETNSGLGQVVLLINALAYKLAHSWKNNKEFISFGSMSSVRIKGMEFKLFGPIERKEEANFNQGLTALLEAVNELYEEYKERIRDSRFWKASSTWHKIERSLIGKTSIHYIDKSIQKWAEPLKYLITNLDFLIKCEQQRAVEAEDEL